MLFARGLSPSFFASFEKLADFALSFSRSFERLADFADFRMFFEENEGADRCFYCFSIIVVQVHTWAFIMTLMTPELTLT